MKWKNEMRWDEENEKMQREMNCIVLYCTAKYTRIMKKNTQIELIEM